MANTTVLPPQKGRRSPKWSSRDALFWTTSEGDITSDLVPPRDSIWLTFKPGSAGKRSKRRKR